MTWSNVRCQVSGVAAALLPVLLILYPLLLLLDDLEPGFVRSVVNPHWFLLGLIVVGMIAGRAGPSPSRSHSRWEGEKLRAVFTLAAAIVVGFWVWWRVGGGRLGVAVGLLTVVAVVGAAAAVVGKLKSSTRGGSALGGEYRNPKQ